MKQDFLKTYFAPSHYFACHLVVPLSPTVPSFCLAWWQHCHCLTILQWYPFPPNEQLLMAVGISMNIVYILNKKISSLVDKTKKERRKNMQGPQMTWMLFGPLLCHCHGLM
jgi:hypothetical protein